MFNLERQHHFIKFTGQGFFLGQEKISGYLHGNGTRALFYTSRGKVGEGSTQYTDVINTTMLIKALVFSSQNCLFHQIGDIPNFDQYSSLFAEFTNQCPLSAINPQRDIRSIIRENLQRWQGGVGQYGGQGKQQKG